MQELDAAVVSRRLDPNRDGKIPWSFRHCSEPYPRGSLHCNSRNPSPTM